MDKGNKARRYRPATRRLIQLYAALLHNAYLRGIVTGEIYQGKAKAACVPGLNCYSCPGATGACPLGALQNALASSGHRAGWYVLGILLLFGTMLGRTICGWLCPFGLIQEILHKIPTPKIRKSRITRMLSWLKYGILAVFVMAIPLWYGLRYDLPLPGFCKYICPAGTLEGAVGHLANPANTAMYDMLGLVFTRKWIVLLAVFLACVFCYRSFCRFICPLGAIYGLFNRFSIVGVKVDRERCNGCGLCAQRCGMDVRCAGDHECISCGRCVDTCSRGAISMKAGRIILAAPETDSTGCRIKACRQTRRILWGAALAFLCIMMLWINVLDPSIEISRGPSPIPDTVNEPDTGHDVGNCLGDFILTCYDGSTFHLADMRGKVVFINLWSTWCTPCKDELPYFNSLCKKHEGDTAVLVVHPSMILDDPESYLDGRGYGMFFATDTDENSLWNTVGGSDTLPQTIVLDRTGRVVYNAVGSVTPEQLEALWREAAGGEL